MVVVVEAFLQRVQCLAWDAAAATRIGIKIEPSSGVSAAQKFRHEKNTEANNTTGGA